MDSSQCNLESVCVDDERDTNDFAGMIPCDFFSFILVDWTSIQRNQKARETCSSNRISFSYRIVLAYGGVFYMNSRHGKDIASGRSDSNATQIAHVPSSRFPRIS